MSDHNDEDDGKGGRGGGMDGMVGWGERDDGTRPDEFEVSWRQRGGESLPQPADRSYRSTSPFALEHAERQRRPA